MKYLLTSSVTLFLAAPLFTEDTALAEASQAIRPGLEAAAHSLHYSLLQSTAAGRGPMAEGARLQLAGLERQARAAD
ncbi:hypothetical protein [Pseudomonas oryzihabitans]|uniref:hypothetical protein n=1 Tax=Pseudomonas oryzihabitans TaxID=47885 RepID=UPI0011A3D7B2|nr:hypothetical protein [Pseudomonas psychrotolerans]